MPCFQRLIDRIIEENCCKGTYAYLDNITIDGKTQQEHDENFQKFLKVAKQCSLTFNEDKSIISSDSIRLRGSKISQGTLEPDPD